MESNMELSDGVNSTNQNFTKKIEFFFCINVYKNAKEQAEKLKSREMKEE